MHKAWILGLFLVLFLAGFLWMAGRNRSEAGGKKEPMLAHMVYFSLKDNSKDAIKKLVDACHKYLSKHPGEVFYAAGGLAGDLKREVNDLDFDVALHLVFDSKAAHDRYQDADRHTQFINENKDNWKKVRVFDSYVTR
ncbi:MAG: Dabb family protein [Gemmataceae bacterium]|nr:Dabb family protein [Gemmataceae bacterium]MCI0738669.1 Dabb family protein [Gemmataceae bacterium]